MDPITSQEVSMELELIRKRKNLTIELEALKFISLVNSNVPQDKFTLENILEYLKTYKKYSKIEKNKIKNFLLENKLIIFGEF